MAGWSKYRLGLLKWQSIVGSRHRWEFPVFVITQSNNASGNGLPPVREKSMKFKANFFQEIVFENVIREMSTILFTFEYVNS